MSPLTGFLGRADYEAVCDRMRLADGALWPMPIMLDVPAEVAGRRRPRRRPGPAGSRRIAAGRAVGRRRLGPRPPGRGRGGLPDHE